MKCIVYHCSPVRIGKFDFTNGVHFGGKLSAYEAALRHRNVGTLFLHKCSVVLQNVLETSDLCEARGWYRLALEMRSEGVSVASYVNKYEPDFSPSYFAVQEGVVEIQQVIEIDACEAEEAVLELLY